MSEGGRSAGSPALRLSNIAKTFPGTRALKGVSFDVDRGVIHALLGGNGSGKSTLLKVLAGVQRGDPGGIIAVGDTEIAAHQTSPDQARALGMHFVHQRPAVFPGLSVAENLAIGRGFATTRVGSIRWRELRRRSQELLDRYDLRVRPDALLGSLRPAERAMVAIARALQDQEDEHSGVLFLDEPTASLPEAEVQRLLAALTRFARAGQTIVFVSHRLDEVLQVADRATVFRDGEVAGTLERDKFSESRFIELIAGRALDRVYPSMAESTSGDVALEVKHVRGGPLRDVSFRLQKGEVLGVAGLLGSGRSELLKMIFGAYPVRSGAIELDGRPLRLRDIGDAMRAGIAYVPEDRGDAAFFDLSLSENVNAAVVGRYWKGLRLRNRSADADARAAMKRFLIRASTEHQPMRTLSGGNQQKVIIARWLRRDPRVLLLDEPTQGVDVNARAETYALVREAVAGGCSVLLVSSDFEELARVADRVIVLADGRVVADVVAPQLEPARLTELAFATKTVAS